MSPDPAPEAGPPVAAVGGECPPESRGLPFMEMMVVILMVVLVVVVVTAVAGGLDGRQGSNVFSNISFGLNE